MLRIALINMPFAALRFPSLALTQLKTVLEDRFKEQVSVDVLYLNQDFGNHLGQDLYQYITTSMDSQNSGIGDWFFRQSAFPETAANSQEYFKRYYPYRTQAYEHFKKLILDKQSTLDAFMRELVTRYNLAEANIVGFTSMFTQNMASFAMARIVKEANPNIVTVMGGANCETPMGEEIAKNVKQIDAVFSGPGLVSFPQFVQSHLEGETDKCHELMGVYSKKNCNSPEAHGQIGAELDINVEVELRYESFIKSLDKNFPNNQMEPALLFETSRGCWWGAKSHCTFCGLNGMTMAYRAMSPQRALKQFDSLFKFGPKVKYYECVDNILPREYLQDVFPNLNTPPHADIFYEVKADLSEEDVKVLSKARVKSIQPGIESLATSTLKLMKKGTTAFQNLFLLKNCLMNDIYPAWNLLIGFPGEEEDVYKKYVQDLPLLMHLPPPTGAYPVRFDRYSPYFMKAKEYQLNLQPLDYYELIYPFSKSDMKNLAYYFSDTNVGAKYALEMSRWIDRIRERTTQWTMLWHGGGGKTEPPKLHFEANGGSNVVFDSRSGQVKRYKVEGCGKEILERLNKPKRLAVLAGELGHLENFDVEKEVKALQSNGLLFQESERFMSLVLPKEPPRMTKLPR